MLLTELQNRRWDADRHPHSFEGDEFGELGPLRQAHSTFDLDNPATLEASPCGGLLRDIGSKVMDQLLWLLGDVQTVSAP